MLLSPDTTYQRASFPAAWQLDSREQQVLQDQLSPLTETLRRVSRSYIGPDTTIGGARLVCQQPELQEIQQVAGITLFSDFDGSNQMMTRLPSTLAAACVGALLGYSPKPKLASEELTRLDLAILRPYLEALANSALRTLFGSHGRHQISPPEAAPPWPGPKSFAVAVPLVAGAGPQDVVFAAPTAAWRNEVEANSPADSTSLKYSQLHSLPVRLEAILPAPAMDLTELQAIGRGDVLLLSDSQKMIVQLQVAGQLVAAGQAGAQGSRLSVRLLETNTYSRSQTAMSEQPSTAAQSEQQLSSAQALEAIREGEMNLESPGGIPVQIQIQLGQVVMPLGELLQLRAGAVVTLDRNIDEPVEILAGNKVVARGEIVVVEDQLGVRILQVADSQQVQTEAPQ